MLQIGKNHRFRQIFSNDSLRKFPNEVIKQIYQQILKHFVLEGIFDKWCDGFYKKIKENIITNFPQQQKCFETFSMISGVS